MSCIFFGLSCSPGLFWLRISCYFFFTFSTFSRLSEFLEKLRTQCHWLQFMSERLCARCTVCIGEKTEPCLRHEERSCRHHDCSHYIPLDGRALCCDLGPGKMLEKESLMPWIKAIEHLKVHNFKYI